MPEVITIVKSSDYAYKEVPFKYMLKTNNPFLINSSKTVSNLSSNDSTEIPEILNVDDFKPNITKEVSFIENLKFELKGYEKMATKNTKLYVYIPNDGLNNDISIFFNFKSNGDYSKRQLIKKYGIASYTLPDRSFDYSQTSSLYFTFNTELTASPIKVKVDFLFFFRNLYI